MTIPWFRSRQLPGDPGARRTHRLAILALAARAAAALSGCAGGQDPLAQKMQYGFSDSPRYRVTDRYQLESRLAKAHGGRVFSEQAEIHYAQATYSLVLRQTPLGGVEADYRLFRLRIHDEAGKFKLEIGPDSGWISWYEENQTLAGYLGPEGYARYQQAIGKPVAVQKIIPTGADAKLPNRGLTFHPALLELLGRNRVYGKILVKTFKIPPLVSVVFPERSLVPGDSWTYRSQAPDAGEINAGRPGLATTFHWESWAPPAAVVAWRNRIGLSGEELKAMGSKLGLESLADRVTFQNSEVRLEGRTVFLPAAQRPASGGLVVRKLYRMTVGGEEWTLAESERHEFTVQPE